MDKKTICDALGLEKLGAYDFALPLSFVAALKEHCLYQYGELDEHLRNLCGQYVWLYPKDHKQGGYGGYPFPLTSKAEYLLKCLATEDGWEWLSAFETQDERQKAILKLANEILNRR